MKVTHLEFATTGWLRMGDGYRERPAGLRMKLQRRPAIRIQRSGATVVWPVLSAVGRTGFLRRRCRNQTSTRMTIPPELDAQILRYSHVES
jgi:hypothetical protein